MELVHIPVTVRVIPAGEVRCTTTEEKFVDCVVELITLKAAMQTRTLDLDRIWMSSPTI